MYVCLLCFHKHEEVFNILISIYVCLFQVRDYIHVIDLADGHIAALRKLEDCKIGMYDSAYTLLSLFY